MSTGGEIHAGGVVVDLEVRTDRLRQQAGQAKTALTEIEKEMELLRSKFHDGAVGGDEFARKMEQLKGAQAGWKAELQQSRAALEANNAAMAAVQAKSDAQITATRTLNVGMAGVKEGAKGGGMGLMMLAQAADDAQYGFKSVVNNIPQLLMAMGVPVQLAGALSMAAVAVNQLSQHWDGFKETFGSDSWFKSLESNLGTVTDGLGQVLDAVLDIATAGNLRLPFMEDIRHQGRAEAERKAEEAAGDAAIKQVTGVGVAGEAERGRAAREAMEASGGGASIMADLLEQSKRGRPVMTPEEEQRARREAAALLQRALQGKEGAAEAVGQQVPGFAKAWELFQPGAQEERDADQAKNNELIKRRRAAEEEEAREREKEDEENLKKFKANTASRQRRVKEVAGEFLSPTGGKITDTGRAALEGKLSVQDIEKHLLAMGADPEKAGRAAEDVGKQVEKNAGKLIGKRAAEERISPEEARKAILADDDERRRQGEKQRADRLQKQAEEKLPGLDALTRREIGLRINAGQTEESATAGATRAIEAALVKAGMKPGDARAAATEEVGDTAHKMSAAMAAHAMKGDQENRRNSEIIKAEDLQGKIQASIGAADPQIQQMKEIAKILGLQTKLMEQQAQRPQVAVLGR
jgi:hypothetical protein